MKILSAHVLFLLGGLFMAICVEGPEAASPANELEITQETTWRRTVNGWEQMSEWTSPPPVTHPAWGHVTAVHPLVFASTQLLLSIFVLLAFPVQHLRSPVRSTTPTTQFAAADSP